ncbi:hypothetical protein GPJ56_000846 [Histomonas meleagridis]|uniref:uncharacterized protein n=1 Tax=Histomonas meleagridis TaxID=135588 RepID=UPI0035593A98|nr:hypothetical protein GPJ56_000846 [Histomonas meleagridis]KAH0801322.1 hypothetical protein GO595_005917 [Histomonas meleagridis]
MKANLIDPNLLFTTDMAECPLITHSVPFVVHHDSVVVSGARLVILNLCALNNDSINQAIMETFTDAPLDCLLQSIHQDELAFLADLLDVAPDPLSQVVMTKLTKALETENNITFCRSVLFLSFGQMRPLMITLIEKRIPLLPQKHILTLSLLQFCCENNLIDVNSLPQTIKSDVFEVFKSRRTFTEFSVSLQLIGLFSKQPPKIVIEVNNELIEEIRKLSPIILMPLLLKIRLLYKPRYDLEAIIENESERNSITQETLLFLQLNEIQFFLNHQNIDNIFVLTAQKNDVVQSYGIIGGGMLRISSDLLIDSNGNVYKLSKLCLKEEEKRALQTSVKMLYVKESESIVKPAITQKLEFNFPSQFVCLAFKAELCKRQTAMINEMLNRLKK